jgi:hypothetical protein
MSLGLVMLAMSAAQAQSLNGGCTATINGRQLPSMTFGDPLEVTKGKGLSVSASVPATSKKAKTQLSVSIGPISKGYSFKGTSYNRGLNPPSWLFSVADGVVLGRGTATGQGYSCSGSGYVKIDGDGLLAIIGGTLLGAGGAAGVANASGSKNHPTEEAPPAQETSGQRTADDPNKEGREIVEMIKEARRDIPKDFLATFILILMFIIIWFFIMGMAIPD